MHQDAHSGRVFRGMCFVNQSVVPRCFSEFVRFEWCVLHNMYENITIGQRSHVRGSARDN